MKKISHGGNIYKKAKEMGIQEEDILDFSANISPLGLPEHIRRAMIEAIDGTINYPDPDCSRLKEAISKQDNVPESHITCGNGGADLLYRLAFGLHPKKYCFRLRLLWSMRKHCPQQVHRWSTILCVMIL